MVANETEQTPRSANEAAEKKEAALEKEPEKGDSVQFQNLEALRDNGQAAVLVLGGSKFMGKALVEELLEHGARVCTVNRGREHWGTSDPAFGRTARVLADREDSESFALLLGEVTRRLGCSWDMVVDFSAFDGSDMNASLEGLANNFKLYVYISSDSIYEVSHWASKKWFPPGPEDEVDVPEEAGVRPQDPFLQEKVNKLDDYGHGKLEAEEVLQEFLPEACRCVVLRLPDVIGPFDTTHRLWAYWHWLQAGESGAPPPQVQSYKLRSKRARTADPEDFQLPQNPPLCVVYSRDVARFTLGLLKKPLPNSDKNIDVVNLGCVEQMPLADLLCLLAKVSGIEKPRPRLEITKDPKTFLPSVDRPWPLSLQKQLDVYGFRPTPLEEVLQKCAKFFEDGCIRFPDEASKAAKKLPQDPADAALAMADLQGRT